MITIVGCVCVVLFCVWKRARHPTPTHNDPDHARVLFDALNYTRPNMALHTDIDREPTEIVPHLYIGRMRDANDTNTLQRLGIGAILNLVAGLRLQLNDDDDTGVGGTIHRLEISARDNPFYDLSQHFDAAYDFIDQNLQNGRNVLVHCHAGRSRSAAIVAMYLQRKFDWSPAHALFFIKGRRPSICPNEGFVKQLLEDYDKRQLGHT